MLYDRPSIHTRRSNSTRPDTTATSTSATYTPQGCSVETSSQVTCGAWPNSSASSTGCRMSFTLQSPISQVSPGRAGPDTTTPIGQRPRMRRTKSRRGSCSAPPSAVPSCSMLQSWGFVNVAYVFETGLAIARHAEPAGCSVVKGTAPSKSLLAAERTRNCRGTRAVAQRPTTARSNLPTKNNCIFCSGARRLSQPSRMSRARRVPLRLLSWLQR